MRTRIAVDVGGTFTDLVLRDEDTGRMVIGKAPTAPERPDEGVLAVVDSVLSAEQLAAAEHFLHGTTVGLNALLEQRGARVGLLCTEGYRDVLEVRRGDRGDPYDLFWHAPPPMVPRHLRVPVAGRIRADGTEHRPFRPEDVTAAAAHFREHEVTAVAVAFIHSYANPAHELEAERLLREAGFEGDVSLSHRISGEYREYERTCTTVIDAFVRRRMGDYLGRLEQGLRDRGFVGSCMIMRSGGGAMRFAEAGDRPFETILSGPVAGARAVADLARTLDLRHAIAADVGGTSFDTCLIDEGRPPVLYQGEVVGLPIQTPWIDVRSVGAGGGSIAHVDSGGLLRVGPRSAGAEPGPACYDRGGTEATVTDAALVLGMIPADRIAGEVPLVRELAEGALSRLAQQLGFESVTEVACGVIRIVAAQMADAIRSVTIERGRDPRDAALVAFGGAGPLFGTVLADELGVSTVVVPPYAGNFSAVGLLGADLARSASRTRVVRLSGEGLADAGTIAEELFAQLDARGPDGERSPLREVHVDLRFVGQEHTLTVPVPAATGAVGHDPAPVAERFLDDYERTFGSVLDEELEIVCVRAISTSPLERHAATATPGAPDVSSNGARGAVRAWSFTSGNEQEFAVLDRGTLEPGAEVEGPAIIREETATTYVDAGHRAVVHATGALLVQRGDGA
ncbi:MAG TPA: hydantoinase/oxoprolinase family protein [Gaiellales bacterium]|nr:hydantoinase/oxoprolinase family protein [Gaiellales bacterium]